MLYQLRGGGEMRVERGGKIENYFTFTEYGQIFYKLSKILIFEKPAL